MLSCGVGRSIVDRTIARMRPEDQSGTLFIGNVSGSFAHGGD
jgi:hypothetical protein